MTVMLRVCEVVVVRWYVEGVIRRVREEKARDRLLYDYRGSALESTRMSVISHMRTDQCARSDGATNGTPPEHIGTAESAGRSDIRGERLDEEGVKYPNLIAADVTRRDMTPTTASRSESMEFSLPIVKSHVFQQSHPTVTQ